MSNILSIIFDPAFFNKLMIFLSACAAIRWAIHGDYTQAMYWAFATGITSVVTFGRWK